MSSSNVVLDIEDAIATVTLARAEARNAMTWAMYDGLVEACRTAVTSSARALIIRGSGGAFSAGTDISQFEDVRTGEDGVAYEQRLEAVVAAVEALPIATIAAVEGPAVGGGCAIAVACDLRLAATSASFGVPVARTLGNCLSAENLARLADLVGTGRVADLLLTGRLVGAEEALAWGLVSRVVPVSELDEEARGLALLLAGRASSTVTATKLALGRLRQVRRPPTGACDDLIAACYGSTEFREGVTAFAERRPPVFS